MPTIPLATNKVRKELAKPLKNVAPLQNSIPALITARREIRSASIPRGNWPAKALR